MGDPPPAVGGPPTAALNERRRLCRPLTIAIDGDGDQRPIAVVSLLRRTWRLMCDGAQSEAGPSGLLFCVDCERPWPLGPVAGGGGMPLREVDQRSSEEKGPVVTQCIVDPDPLPKPPTQIPGHIRCPTQRCTSSRSASVEGEVRTACARREHPGPVGTAPPRKTSE